MAQQTSCDLVRLLRGRLTEVLVPPLYSLAQSIYKNTQTAMLELNRAGLGSEDARVVADVKSRMPNLVLERFQNDVLRYLGDPQAFGTISNMVLVSSRDVLPEFDHVLRLCVYQEVQAARVALGAATPPVPALDAKMQQEAGILVDPQTFCQCAMRNVLNLFQEHPALMDVYVPLATQMDRLQTTRAYIGQCVHKAIDLMVPLRFLLSIHAAHVQGSLPQSRAQQQQEGQLAEQVGQLAAQMTAQMTVHARFAQDQQRGNRELVELGRQTVETLQQLRTAGSRAQDEGHQRLERQMEAERRQARLDLEALHVRHRSQTEELLRTIGELKRASEGSHKEMARLRAETSQLQDKVARLAGGGIGVGGAVGVGGGMGAGGAGAGAAVGAHAPWGAFQGGGPMMIAPSMSQAIPPLPPSSQVDPPVSTLRTFPPPFSFAEAPKWTDAGDAAGSGGSGASRGTGGGEGSSLADGGRRDGGADHGAHNTDLVPSSLPAHVSPHYASAPASASNDRQLTFGNEGPNNEENASGLAGPLAPHRFPSSTAILPRHREQESRFASPAVTRSPWIPSPAIVAAPGREGDSGPQSSSRAGSAFAPGASPRPSSHSSPAPTSSSASLNHVPSRRGEWKRSYEMNDDVEEVEEEDGAGSGAEEDEEDDAARLKTSASERKDGGGGGVGGGAAALAGSPPRSGSEADSESRSDGR